MRREHSRSRRCSEAAVRDGQRKTRQKRSESLPVAMSWKPEKAACSSAAASSTGHGPPRDAPDGRRRPVEKTRGDGMEAGEGSLEDGVQQRHHTSTAPAARPAASGELAIRASSMDEQVEGGGVKVRNQIRSN